MLLDQKTLEKHLIKLDRENYHVWSEKMTGLLTFLSLVDHLQPNDSKQQDDEYWQQDKEVMNLIVSSLTQSFKNSVEGMRSAAECWSAVKIAWQQSNSELELFSQLQELTFDLNNKETLQNSLEQFEILFNKIGKIKLMSQLPKTMQNELTNEDYESIKKRLLITESVVNKQPQTSPLQVEQPVDELTMNTDQQDVTTEQQQKDILKCEKMNTVDDSKPSTLDEPFEYKDKPFILDSSKMEGKFIGAASGGDVIQDIRFMKPEDLEASIASPDTRQSSGTQYLGFIEKRRSPTRRRNEKRKSKNRSRNRNNSTSRTSGDFLSKSLSNDNVSIAKEPDENEGHVNMALFKKLQTFSCISKCTDTLNTDHIRPAAKGYSST